MLRQRLKLAAISLCDFIFPTTPKGLAAVLKVNQSYNTAFGPWTPLLPVGGEICSLKVHESDKVRKYIDFSTKKPILVGSKKVFEE